MPRSEVLIPEITNVTLTSADTEYSHKFAVAMKYFSAQCRTAFDCRYAFATGRVATPTAPYATIKSGQWYNSPEKFSAAQWDDEGVTAVAEANTITVAGTWSAADAVTITLNGRTLVVTIGSLVTLAQVAETIKQAWNSETFTDGTATVVPAGGGTVLNDFDQLTATASGAVVTLTGDNAGVAWNQNSSLLLTEDSAGSAPLANSVAASGPASTIYLASAEAGVIVELIQWKVPRA
jgi:hypothetical protein